MIKPTIRDYRIQRILAPLLFCSLFLEAAGHTYQGRPKSTHDFAEVTLCEMVRNPEKYDGKNVIVQATYRYGFEWAELYCMGCREAGRTWVEFDTENWIGSMRELRKLPTDNLGRTVNATFCGTFHSSKPYYGHEAAYRFLFAARCMKDMKIIHKNSVVPDRLPPDILKKVCHELTTSSMRRLHSSGPMAEAEAQACR